MDIKNDPTRNLALELVRVTEAAAMASGRFLISLGKRLPGIQFVQPAFSAMSLAR